MNISLATQSFAGCSVVVVVDDAVARKLFPK